MTTRDKDLEIEIQMLPSVIEVAVFSDDASHPIEIQVWSRAGSSEREIRQQVADLLSVRGLLQYNERTYVFELSPESTAPGNTSPIGKFNPIDSSTAENDVVEESPLERPRSERKQSRPRIGKILVTAGGDDAKANVSLIYEGRESEGVGKGRRTQYALQVTAATTLEAAQALLGTRGIFSLKGATLVETLGYAAVLVILESKLQGGHTLIGSSLVRDSEVAQATVRAALDAVNRQLEMALQ